ncbi:MAG: tRNA (5-methylaminomethyl-2-thiouridine)(34)-methyltransferase MnmD [Bacteroidota bacterium]|nr:tRNA (5-methylaminomethyl-2-thiouridine)(34)-methyltransferase MnmD [Bacteroidota bacterium]
MQITPTADGNPTLYSEQFASHYHSVNGSMDESNCIFIENNLAYYTANYLPNIIHIFEMGFGTGLNACLAVQFATENKINIIYHTIELYPVEKSIIEQLHFKFPNREVFKQIHDAAWETAIIINPYFTLYKHEGDFCKYDIKSNYYNIFFMDAFGPDHQPAMWEEIILQKIYNSLLPNGVLTTFSARGSFRRALQHIGFAVERLPGPVGKRHITRGVK